MRRPTMTAWAIPTGTDSAAGMRCKAQTRLTPHGRAWATPRRQGRALRALRGLDGIGAGAGLRPLAARSCSLHRARAWAKLASTQKTSKHGRAAFVSTSPARTASSETRFLYDGLASGVTIYGYVGGNPVNAVDPLGLNPGMGSGTQSCAHYERRCTESGGKSTYYCTIAPLVCQHFPDSDWARCSRKCLQDYDNACGRNSDGSPHLGCTEWDAHIHCWKHCPSSPKPESQCP